MIRAMKLAWGILPSCALALLLSSCGNQKGGSAGSVGSPGPFDSRGNYVEEWADNPSKWRRPGGSPSPHELRSDELPEVALNDQPPSNSIPLAPSRSTSSRTVVSEQPKPTTRSSSSQPVVVKSTTRPSTSKTSSSPKPTTTSRSTTVKTTTKPKTVAAKSKPKPKTVRYTVKKGDSLSAIASRNGTSVTELKRANGISGTTIRPGQSLTIPK